MSTNASNADRSTDDRTPVRHSKADVLTDREFELLLKGCTKLKPHYQTQARFAVLAAGRLGLRAGEIAHLRESWIDWRRGLIDIPRHQTCTTGRDNSICGYCRQNAQQMTTHNPEMTIEEAEEMMWNPKTEASERGVPFDFSPRVELAIEQFFDQHDRWPACRQSINRRIERAAEAANGITAEAIYPHALRATAATFHAARGLSVLPLKSMFGWSQLSTAQKYVASSDDNTCRAVRATHSR